MTSFDDAVACGNLYKQAEKQFSRVFGEYLRALPTLEDGDYWQLQHAVVQDMFVDCEKPADAARMLFERPSQPMHMWGGNCSYKIEDAFRFVATYFAMLQKLIDWQAGEDNEFLITESLAGIPLSTREIYESVIKGDLDDHDLYQSLNEWSHLKYGVKYAGEFLMNETGQVQEIVERFVSNARASFIGEMCTKSSEKALRGKSLEEEEKKQDSEGAKGESNERKMPRDGNQGGADDGFGF